MIAPTSDFDPLFADDGIPFAEKMRGYIQAEFADVLGTDARLLVSDEGLEKLLQIYGGVSESNAAVGEERKAA